MQIVLDSQVINLAPGESRSIPVLLVNRSDQERFVVLQALGLPSEWISLEPQTVLLKPGEQQQLNLIINPPVKPDGMARRYRIRLQAAPQGGTEVLASVEANVSVAAFQTGGRIGILLPATQFSVSPGSQVTIPLTLVNNGLQADIFRLHVDGLPAAWVSSPAVLTQLEPGEQQEAELTIQPPKIPQSEAGRHPFTIRIESREDPAQPAEAACTLTVAAYSQSTLELHPREIQAGQVARVTIHNEGNIPETFRVTFLSGAEPLLFEAVLAGQEMPVGGDGSQTTPSFAEIRSPLILQVPAGGVGEIVFHGRPVSPPLLGEEVYYSFSVVVEKQPDQRQSLEGQVVGRAWLPRWVIPALLITLVSCMCLFSFILNTRRSSRASQTQTAEALNLQIAAATQTAAFNQTQAVVAEQVDSDGDGLNDGRELELGSDPNLADSDGDELLDGPEVDSHATNPLNPDSDGDGLSDGEEVLRRGSDPLSPDSDQDGLGDGDEARLGTNLLNPDTDGDGLVDGAEVQVGTDPLNPDSDSDRLPDGRETADCPSPLNPDSDGDGIIDGLDLEPCDPANPALTATAGSSQPTATLVPATQAPTAPPSATPTAVSPTAPPPTSPPGTTPAPGALPGKIAYESDRDGNPEIYVLNLEDGAVQRLSNHPASDIHPSWSPDGSHIVFASNRDGNYEIYSVAADGSDLIRLTDHPAEDSEPRWSPDGSRIVFASNRDGNREIYGMNADGSNPVNLTNNPADDFQPFWYVQNTALILETEWILFTSVRDGNREIYTMLPDGGEQVDLSNHPADDSYPAPLDNGNRIAFVSLRDGNPEVYVMDSNGALPENLTIHPAADLAPYPSTDQSWLAFATDRDGNWEIYALRIEDGALLNVTSNPANDQQPSWFIP